MALYGLPEAGQRWNDTLRDFLISINFKSLKSDPNLYYYSRSNGDFCLLPTVVDDTLDVCNSEEMRKEIHKKLLDRFGWKTSGKCSWFLGCKVSQNYLEISIDQRIYLKNLIKTFESFDIRRYDTPASEILLQPPDEDERVTDFPYAQLVGSLLWLMRTRPDIAYAVGQCAKYINNHSELHDKAAKRILGYLMKYPDYGIVFPKCDQPSETKLDVELYSDASWADDRSDGFSSYGYLVCLNGASIAWKSKKTLSICLSSCESEYYALSEASNEAFYLNNLLSELKFDYNFPPTLKTDSMPAIRLAEVPRVNERTKHVGLKLHFVRWAVSQGLVSLKYVPTDQNIADIFTKPLGRVKFNALRPFLVELIDDDHVETIVN